MPTVYPLLEYSTSRASILSSAPLLQHQEVLNATFPGSVRRHRGRCDDVDSEAQLLLLERQAAEDNGDVGEQHNERDDPVLDLDETQIENVI